MRWFEMIYDLRVCVYSLSPFWTWLKIKIYQFGFVRVALYTAVVFDSTGFQGSQVGWISDSWKLQERRSDIHWPTRNMLQLLWVFVQRICRSEGLKDQMWLLAHRVCWYLCCSFRRPLLINPCYESLITLIPLNLGSSMTAFRFSSLSLIRRSWQYICSFVYIDNHWIIGQESSGNHVQHKFDYRSTYIYI